MRTLQFRHIVVAVGTSRYCGWSWRPSIWRNDRDGCWCLGWGYWAVWLSWGRHRKGWLRDMKRKRAR